MARPINLRSVSTVTRAYSRDPLERIDSISGVNADRTRWSYSQAVAIARIEAGTDEFVVLTGESAVRLIVHASGGQKYLHRETELAG